MAERSERMSDDVPQTDTIPDDDERAPEPDEQVVEAYPVLADAAAVERARLTPAPAVQAAAIAATGFVAGAATVALLRRRNARRLTRARLEEAALRELRHSGELAKRTRGSRRRSKSAGEQAVETVATTYLVNVRLLARTQD